jgi:hypothetical protein
MVLDANVDPRRVWYLSQFDRDRAFDRNMDIYFEWIARYDDVYHLGRTEHAVKRLYYSVLADLDRRPAGGLIGPAEWNDLFLGAGYYIFDWEAIANAFEGWVHRREWQPLQDLYDAASGIGDDNGFAVYLGVQCTDTSWPPFWAKWQQDTWAVHQVAPFTTWGNTWFNAPCLFWPAESEEPVRIDGRRVRSALLLSEQLDAATPFEGSLEVRARFPGSSLIAGPGGTTHAASLFGNACVDDQIAAYLATGALPPRLPGRRADTTCPPLPQPVPAEVAARTQQDTDLAAARERLREAMGPIRAG